MFDLCIDQRYFVLISAHKPPSVNNTTFTSELTLLLHEPFRTSENVICIGDLNCDIINPLHNNQQGKCLLDICDIYDQDSLITSSTHISTNTASCLDVSHPDKCSGLYETFWRY